MDQAPAIPGGASHAGMALTAAAFRAKPNQGTWYHLLSQFLWGWVLLDVTASSEPTPGDGDAVGFEQGDVIGFRTIRDKDGREGLTIFTSQAEIHKILPPEQTANAKSLIESADGIFSLIETMGLDFVLIDPGGAAVDVDLATGLQVTGGPHDVGIRAAVELGEAARGKILEGLEREDGTLIFAADPESIGPDGSLDHVVLRSSTSPSGTRVMTVYTSALEVALFAEQDIPVRQDYLGALRICATPGYDGMVINPGTRWLHLDGAEVKSALERREPGPN